MIAGLSKAVTLYLAPLLALTTIFLTLFALLAPNLLLQDQVALLTVIPSTALQSRALNSIDGPSIFMGILGADRKVTIRLCRILTHIRFLCTEQ
jgi:hypothetical protein